MGTAEKKAADCFIQKQSILIHGEDAFCGSRIVSKITEGVTFSLEIEHAARGWKVTFRR